MDLLRASRMPIALLACAVLLAAAGATEPAPAAGAPGPGDTGRLGAVLADPGTGGFARADRIRAFRFPQDHGPHPDYRHEWWYVTGNLDAPTGERFGFELTFFRFALAPSAGSAGRPGQSRWRTRQVYMAHFAVTDVARGRFHSGERFARDALGLAGARAQPFRVWLQDWELREPEESGGGPWLLTAADGPYALEIELRASGPPVANGDRGLSRKSAAPGAASYYYSIPRLQARGRLVREGVALDVRGLAWLDREWGSGALGAEQTGWDWYALQLSDGSALMFYALRRRDGRRDPHSAGTWVAADGSTRRLASDAVHIDVEEFWTSPRGGRYPARWRLRVPALGIDYAIRPVLADQELGTSPRYWEGAVDVQGSTAGIPVAGRGYVELVGYAR